MSAEWMEKAEIALKEARVRRDAYLKKLRELGFVAECWIESRIQVDIGGNMMPQWGGTAYLRNDGSLWCDANDGNIPGLENTGLVCGMHSDGVITRVNPL